MPYYCKIAIYWYCPTLQSLVLNKYMTWHEQIGLIYRKYTLSLYSTYLTFCASYTSCINYDRLPIVCCTSCKSLIDTHCLGTQSYETLNSKKQWFLCAHFLMLGHILYPLPIYTVHYHVTVFPIIFYLEDSHMMVLFCSHVYSCAVAT